MTALETTKRDASPVDALRRKGLADLFDGDRQFARAAVHRANDQRSVSPRIIARQLGDVAQAHADPRAYAMLAELNVKPRTRYLAKIRNPHPWVGGGHVPQHSLPEHDSQHQTGKATG